MHLRHHGGRERTFEEKQTPKCLALLSVLACSSSDSSAVLGKLPGPDDDRLQLIKSGRPRKSSPRAPSVVGLIERCSRRGLMTSCCWLHRGTAEHSWITSCFEVSERRFVSELLDKLSDRGLFPNTESTAINVRLLITGHI